MYASVIRPVLEYACRYGIRVFPCIYQTTLKLFRKIFPGHSYDEARPIANLPTLFERRTKLCQSYFRKMHNADHKLNNLLPNQRNISYGLSIHNNLPFPLARTDRFRPSLITWGLPNWEHNVLLFWIVVLSLNNLFESSCNLSTIAFTSFLRGLSFMRMRFQFLLNIHIWLVCLFNLFVVTNYNFTSWHYRWLCVYDRLYG